jgi:hypothetical protein
MAELDGQLSMVQGNPMADRKRQEKDLLRRQKEMHQEDKKAKAQPFKVQGYVSCELDKDLKDHFTTWMEQQNGSLGLSQVGTLVEDGYILKCTVSDKGYMSSLCAWQTGLPWDGQVLTARASSAHKSLLLLFYKHYQLMQADWSAWVGTEDTDFLR